MYATCLGLKWTPNSGGSPQCRMLIVSGSSIQRYTRSVAARIWICFVVHIKGTQLLSCPAVCIYCRMYTVQDIYIRGLCRANHQETVVLWHTQTNNKIKGWFGNNKIVLYRRSVNTFIMKLTFHVKNNENLYLLASTLCKNIFF